MSFLSTPPARSGAPRGQRAGSNLQLYSWFFMRISGVFLLFLVFGHVVITHVINDVSVVNYAFVVARWESPFWRTYDWLMLILALTHGLNGLKTIIDDYVHRPAYHLLSLTALTCFGAVFLIVGSLVILTFSPVVQ